MRIGTAIVFALPLSLATASAATLTVPSAPDDVAMSKIRIQVRLAGGEWQPAPVYHATSMAKRPHAGGGVEGFVLFAHDAPVEVKAEFPHAAANAVLRPVLRGAPDVVCDGNGVCVALDRPRYLVLEVNYGEADLPASTLYVLADAPESDVPEPGHPGVKAIPPGRHKQAELLPDTTHRTILFTPGLHQIEEGVLQLASKSRVHIASGAVLRAKIAGIDVEDVALTGHGIIDGSETPRRPGDWRSEGEQAFVFLRRGARVTIDGPVIWNSPYWNIVLFGTRNATIRNHKCITWKVNNDGVQPRSCTDLLVEHCFLKCADDCIAVKTRRAAGMESRRLRFRDLVCWNDQPGNALEIGHTSQADLLEDVLFQDIAVVFCDHGRAISMCIIDHSTVRNVRYENVSVEGAKDQDIGLRVSKSRYTTDAGRGRVEHVRIRDFRSDGPPRGGEISGFDPKHGFDDVLIQGALFWASDPAKRRKLTDLSALKLKLRHARNIRVEAY